MCIIQLRNCLFYELRSAELESRDWIGMAEFQEKRQETAMPIANRSLLDKDEQKKKGRIVEQSHVRRNTEV